MQGRLLIEVNKLPHGVEIYYKTKVPGNQIGNVLELHLDMQGGHVLFPNPHDYPDGHPTKRQILDDAMALKEIGFSIRYQHINVTDRDNVPQR